jgi:predicted nucleic acid-binding protein
VILADTNILLRTLYSSDPLYAIADNALAELRRRRETICICPQNLIEFWAVATRPRDAYSNGLGMDTATATKEMTALLNLFRLLPYTPDVLEEWRRMVMVYGISGKQTHDAHLVALMQVHSVTSILTFNDRHFKR